MGMATVWLAEDLRHHRKVGIKLRQFEIQFLGAGAEAFVFTFG